MDVKITLGPLTLNGNLTVPDESLGLVLFAHGSGSSRLSPRNRYVATSLNQKGLATLLLDLLTEEEEAIDDKTALIRFDIPLLAKRLKAATKWAFTQKDLAHFNIGYFGSSTGAAAALIAAGDPENRVAAVVSRGGRPDLAKEALKNVHAPTLLIVGGRDTQVITLNKEAQKELKESKLEIVAHATHLFEEEGALEAVSELAGLWFVEHFMSTSSVSRE